jgi:hypothetical protein
MKSLILYVFVSTTNPSATPQMWWGGIEKCPAPFQLEEAMPPSVRLTARSKGYRLIYSHCAPSEMVKEYLMLGEKV